MGGGGEEGRKDYQFFIKPAEFDSCLYFEKKKKRLWEGG